MDTDMCLYIKKMDNHISRYVHTLYSRKTLDECTLANMWVVDYLYHNQQKDMFQKDIEEHFFINKATASKMLTLMEEKELITREASSMDSRRKKITLQKKGYVLQQICQSIRRELEAEVTACLTEAEVKTFKSLSLKIIHHMSDLEKTERKGV